MSEHCLISIKSSAWNDEQPLSPKNCRSSTSTLLYSVKPTVRWVEEAGSGYLFNWKEKHDGEKGMHSVLQSRPVSTSIYQMIPIAISEQLMTIHLTLPSNNFITLVLVYALTLFAGDTKKQFYHNWQIRSSEYQHRKSFSSLGTSTWEWGKITACGKSS